MTKFSATPRGIYVVWLRHFTVFREDLLMHTLSVLYQPLLFLLAVRWGLSPLVGDVEYFGNSVTYLNFLAPGIMALVCLQQSLSDASYSTFVALHYSKLWQARLTSSLTFDEIILGDLSWGITMGMMTTNLLGFLFCLCGAISFKILLLFQPILFLGALVMGSIGLVVAGASRTYPHIAHSLHFLMAPMLLLCGVFFPRSSYPYLLDKIVAVFPLALVLDLLRSYLGGPHGWLNLVGLVVLSSLTFLLGRRLVYRRIYGV